MSSKPESPQERAHLEAIRCCDLFSRLLHCTKPCLKRCCTLVMAMAQVRAPLKDAMSLAEQAHWVRLG